MKIYYSHKIEKKIQKFWYKNKIFKTKINKNKKKYYCLCMIPYPSGKLHMGHVRNYTIGDIIARYQRLNNKNVLYPIGWDSFGLPAENAAINNKISPYKWTIQNIKYMKKQLQSLGYSYDWNKEIITCKSKFYKWEQWLFIKLLKHNLIYKKLDIVNWCNQDKTVLANEQVINKKCWRCNNKIKYKNISQWFIKITKYSKILFNHLKLLKYWPKEVKKMQEKWIGKLKIYKLNFKIKKINKKINIFIKNLKFITASTCICISINHKIINLLSNLDNTIKKNIFKYKNKKIKIKKKYFAFKTKFKSFNPITKEKISIWITNFSNINYSTESILLTPKYIKEQYIFAKIFKIKTKKIFKNFNPLNYKNEKLINSKSLDGLNIKQSKKKIFYLLNKKIKKKKIFKLHDWIISRQRYWGVPIPIIYIKNKYKNLNYNNLPIKLPKNIIINKNNLNQLKSNNKWKNTTFNNKKAIRETDTLDTFLETSWYHIRYTSLKNKKKIINTKKANYWLPIDTYIGGIEHANMHLIYLRFIHKFFYKINLLKSKEPIKNLICQGMVLYKTFYFIKNNQKIWVNYKNIITKFKNNKIKYLEKNKKKKLYYDGFKKMSKSKNNGIEPNNIIKKYGSDTLRLFIIFSAPINKNLKWNDKNIIGCYRYLKKLWNLTYNFKKIKLSLFSEKNSNINKKKYIKLKFLLNITIYKINKNFKKNKNFNVIISQIMNLTNKLKSFKICNNKEYSLYKNSLKTIIILIYPFTPHISFYLWKKLKNKNIIDYTSWPKYNKKYLKQKYINILIQINGKMKNLIKIKYKKKIKKEKIINKIYNKNIINKFIINKKIKKIIFIKNKIINFII